jgi:hypothetical protein
MIYFLQIEQIMMKKVAHIVTDYVDLVKRLKYLAERYSTSKQELDHLLGSHVSSKAQKEL